MRKSIFITAVLLISTAITGAFVVDQMYNGSSYAAAFEARPHEFAPPFTLPDLDNRPRSLSEWQGKVVVLNFWATWCPPCRKEIPAFNKLQKKYAAKGLQFVGIAIDDKTAVKKFLEIIPIDYELLVGDANAIEIAKTYGNLSGVLPYTIIIDRQGKIVSITEGALSEREAEQAIRKLL